jgi:HEPN superfamily RiboL-PSP-like protein
VDLVDALYSEQQEVMLHLRNKGEISYAAALERSLPKVILLASASNLERQVCDAVLDFFSEMTSAQMSAVNFVKNKAVKRQYHTYFSWDLRNANAFFGLFGEDLKNKVSLLVHEDETLNQAIRDFLEIGSLRNQLVHEDYSEFTVEKTAQDIFDQHKSALLFVVRLPGLLRMT